MQLAQDLFQSIKKEFYTEQTIRLVNETEMIKEIDVKCQEFLSFITMYTDEFENMSSIIKSIKDSPSLTFQEQNDLFFTKSNDFNFFTHFLRDIYNLTVTLGHSDENQLDYLGENLKEHLTRLIIKEIINKYIIRGDTFDTNITKSKRYQMKGIKTGYIYFIQEIAPIYKTNNPVSNSIMTFCAQEWQKLSDLEKKKYNDLAQTYNDSLV